MPEIVKCTCQDCGHIGNVSTDCALWACVECGLIQEREKTLTKCPHCGAPQRVPCR